MALLVNDTDLAYLAGLIDGEGSISLVRSGSRTHGRLEIYNTNRDVLDWVSVIFGGTVCPVGRPDRPKWKQEFVWHCGPQHAAALLSRCISYLKIKRLQADLFMIFVQTIGQHGVPTPTAVLEQRDILVFQMRSLNKRGI